MSSAEAPAVILESYKPFRGPGLYVRATNRKCHLESVLHNVSIVDFAATVTTTQEYVVDIPTGESATVLYKFKLEEGVLPYSCVSYATDPITNEVRVLRAVTVDKETAPDEFDEVNARASFAACMQQEEEADIKSISLGIVQAGLSIRIIFSYVQKTVFEKHIDDDDDTVRLRLTVPALHESLPPETLSSIRPNVSVSLTAKIYNIAPSSSSSPCSIFELSSISHPESVDVVLQEEEGGDEQGIAMWRLSTSTEISPMQDFVVAAKLRNYPVAKWICQKIPPKIKTPTSAIVADAELTETEEDDDDEFPYVYAHAVSILPQFRLSEWEQVRTEMILIVDRSGSMSGQRIGYARDALTLFFNSLDEDYLIRFNIVSFGTKSTSLFPSPERLTEATYTTAIKHIASMEADYGTTDILTPLETALGHPIQPGYSRQIFLVTDGEDSNGNTDSIIAAARSHAHTTRIFTFGIGSGINKTLISEVARVSRGFPVFIERDSQIQLKVMVPLDKALHPAFTNVSVQFGGCVGLIGEGEEQEGEGGGGVQMVPIEEQTAISALFNYRRGMFYYFSSELPETLTLTISYDYGDEERKSHRFQSPIRAETAQASSSSSSLVIPRLAAARRIKLLEEKEQDNISASSAAEIKRLGLRLSLLSSQTTFLMAETITQEEQQQQQQHLIPAPTRYRVVACLPDPSRADWEKRMNAILRRPDFYGLWSDLSAVAQFLGLTEEVTMTPDNLTDKFWLTALVVVALRRAYAPLLVQWNLLVKKSVKSLRKAEKEEELIGIAEGFLRTRLEVPDWDELFAAAAAEKKNQKKGGVVRDDDDDDSSSDDDADDYQQWRGGGFMAGGGLFGDDDDDSEEESDDSDF